MVKIYFWGDGPGIDFRTIRFPDAGRVQENPSDFQPGTGTRIDGEGFRERGTGATGGKDAIRTEKRYSDREKKNLEFPSDPHRVGVGIETFCIGNRLDNIADGFEAVPVDDLY